MNLKKQLIYLHDKIFLFIGYDNMTKKYCETFESQSESILKDKNIKLPNLEFTIKVEKLINPI